MSRPAVSVVMPFGGDTDGARAAAAVLRGLATIPGDELILADNWGTAPPLQGIDVVPAPGERSPAHARNAGAARAHRSWTLFLDADCVAPAGLLDSFLADPVDAEVGAISGGILPAPGSDRVAERYAAARNFLSPASHLAHPYLPRAPAANLLVRTEAFQALGGFREGLRAAEDTDFCWRLQRAGWRLELREDATVQHAYRPSLTALRRQWREYAAGRAWLAEQYPDYRPEPALARALRGRGRRSAGTGPAAGRAAPPAVDRARFAVIDLVLAIEELRGLRQANVPEAGR